MQHIIKHLFKADSLDEVPRERLEALVEEFPSFGMARYLLSRKLRAEEATHFVEETQKTNLYFTNPFWLQWLLENDLSPAAARSHQPAAEQPVIEEKEIEPIVEQPEEPIVEQPVIEEREVEQVVEQPVIEEPAAVAGEEPSVIPDEQPEVQEVPLIVEEQPTVMEEQHDDEELPPLTEEEQAGEKETLGSFLSWSSAPSEPVAPSAEPAVLSTEPVAAASEPVGVASEPVAQPGEPMFQSYHTIDYFASQGIKLTLDENPSDRLGKQLKSFTDWLKVMKRIPQQGSGSVPDIAAEHQVQAIAAHSIEGKEVLTEAMAEVLVKQGMRERAAELYHKLSLLNPDKSSYFAKKIEQLKEF